MKIRTRLAVLAIAFASPALAQDAQMPTRLEQRLDAAFDVEIPAPASSALASRERAMQAALTQNVSARVAVALTPPPRLGAVVARRAPATAPSMRGRRVLYAAK